MSVNPFKWRTMLARWAKGQKRPTVASVIYFSYIMRQEVQFEKTRTHQCKGDNGPSRGGIHYPVE